MRKLCISTMTTAAWAGLALAAACSSDDRQGDRGVPASGAGDIAQGADIADGFAAGAELGDLSIPALGGGAVARISDGGAASVYLITYPGDRFDELVAYYDEWTSGEPEDYERRQGGSGGVTWQLARPGLSRIITVLAPLEGEDNVSVSLTESVSTD